MTTIDKQTLRAYAEQEINYIVDLLFGVARNELQLDLKYRRFNDRIIGSCPCLEHPGDHNSNAFSWSDQYRHWVCFTHHCEQEHTGDVLGLIQGVLGVGFKDALEWVHDALTAKGTDLATTPVQHTHPDPSKPGKHRPIDEHRLRFLEPKLDILLARGFDPDVLAKYQVGYWSRVGTFMHNHIIFPIRDELGNLIGFSGRSLFTPDERDIMDSGKWKHSRYFDRYGEIQMGSVLYNLNNAKRHLGPEGKIILVEGPLDGMRLEEAGIHNWVACCGTGFGPAHRTLLIKAGVNHMDIATDPDKAGDFAAVRTVKLIKDFFHYRRVRLPVDPGDCSIAQLREAWPV